MPVFVFDTSVWAYIGRHHPSDIFVTLWGNIDGLIGSDELRSPEEVLHELRAGTDDLADRLSSRRGLFVPLTHELQEAVREVMGRCPGLADHDSDRNRADPFVVGLARLAGGVVVTGERTRRGQTGRLRIPDACNEFHLTYLDWFGFLRQVRWRL